MTDPITDMLNRIKSAGAVNKTEIVLPYSELKNEVAKILVEAKFLEDAKKVAKGKTKTLKIVLKYDNGVFAISGLRRISKPGQRIYQKSTELKKIQGGYGISVVSTPKGLMTNSQARKQNLGGEIICEVW